MPNSDQITIQIPYLQDKKSLTLISEWGSDRVAVSSASESCKYIIYA